LGVMSIRIEVTPTMASEQQRVPVGAPVRLRGAPGIGTGRVVGHELIHGGLRVLVQWQGLDEGKSYTFEQWEKSRDLVR
jgi:hypothetical protein